jgi:hypothetical protein
MAIEVNRRYLWEASYAKEFSMTDLCVIRVLFGFAAW